VITVAGLPLNLGPRPPVKNEVVGGGQWAIVHIELDLGTTFVIRPLS